MRLASLTKLLSKSPTLILGILLFFVFLASLALKQSLWLDEAITGQVAQMSVMTYFSQFAPTDFHPPLYYLIEMGAVKIMGVNDLVLRIPSLLFALGTLITIRQIGKKLQFKNVTTLVLILGTNPLFLYYAIEARMYMLSTFLISLSIWYFLQSESQHSQRKYSIGFMSSLSLAFLTHYLTLAMIPVYILGSKYSLKRFKQVLLSCLVLILISPILSQQIVHGLDQQGTIWGNVLGEVSLKNLVLIPIKFTLGRISPNPFWLYASLVGVVFLFYSLLILPQYKKLKLQPLPLLWLCLPILVGMIISFRLPMLSYFRFLFCLPALSLIIVQSLQNQKFALRLISLIVVFQIGVYGYFLLQPKSHREPWKQAVAKLNHEATMNRIVVFTFPQDSPAAWQWYQQFYPSSNLTSIALMPNTDESKRNAQFANVNLLYYFDYLNDIFDPQKSILQWFLDHGFSQSDLYQFPGIGAIRVLSREPSFALITPKLKY